MKIYPTATRHLFFAASLSLAGFLGLSATKASADDYIFNNGNGGNGTWENGAGTVWSGNGTQNLLWDNTLSNTAVFGTDGNASAPGGTVDVVGDVTANYLKFNATSDVTLNGPGTITVSTGNGVLENDTNNNVTIGNNLQLDDSINSDRFDITDSGANTLTLSGNISYTGSNNRPSGQALIFNGGAATKFVLNGSFQGSATNPGRLVLSGGTMYLNGTYTNANSGSLLEVDSGNVYLGSSTLGTGTISLGGGVTTTPQLLTVGAQNITNLVSGVNYAFTDPFSSGAVIVGGSTADHSSFAHIDLVVTDLTLTAVAGGRVDIGSITNSTPTGVTKTGAGTVVLDNANTYSINNYSAPPGTVAADIKQGTLLINNQTGSAFGNNSGVVNVEAGTTLGGKGISTQKVVAVSASSVIAPGDPSVNGGIGKLTLAGGLSAENGITMDFTLDGTNPNSVIDLAGSILQLNGPMTFNFTNIGGALALGTDYTIMTGISVNSDVFSNTLGNTYTINAPAGYTVDAIYPIYNSDADNKGTLTVQFEAVPEPSAYAMIGLGLLALVGIRRFRRLSA